MREPKPRSDDGFTLLEAVLAAVVLAVTASVVAGMTIRLLEVVKDNTQRTTATNLAAAQIETYRAMRAVDIFDGRQQVTQTVPANGGTTYTITRDASYVALDSAVDACAAAAAALAYKLVSVSVSWPGAKAPVRSDVLRSLGVGKDALDAGKGSVAIKVQDSQAAGVPDVDVTVSGPSGVAVGAPRRSGAEGCVVFTSLPAGNYSATVNTAGLVSTEGKQLASGGFFGVTAGQVARTVVPYDRPGALTVNLAPAAGYTPPALLPVTVRSSLWTDTQRRVLSDCGTAGSTPPCVSGTSTARTTTTLFPAKYTAWAGSCADAESDPVALQDVVSGGTAALTASLGSVDVAAAPSEVGKPFYAVHVADPGSCAAGESYDLGTLSSNGVKVALPYGTWYLQESGSAAVPVALQQVVLTAAAPAGAVTVRQ